jgi:glycosyltransferase involved in cell wall biosynthesis
MSLSPAVSVIIPTMAAAARARLLLGAIESLRQQSVQVAPIVVVNGSRFDRDLVDHLKNQRDMRFFYREEGSQAHALLFGREMVDTPYFATLDDDDEYLPNAVAVRLGPLRDDPTVDVVVTNGYEQRGETAVIDYPDFAELSIDPLAALTRQNWLQPVNAMFRSSTITSEHFKGMPDYLEWTYLALRLAMTRKIRFVNIPTYRMNRGTVESMSASWPFMLGQPKALRRLLELNPPPIVRKVLRRRLSATMHDISERFRQEGDMHQAWSYHLRSLVGRGGYRYLSYTRRLRLRHRAS